MKKVFMIILCVLLSINSVGCTKQQNNIQNNNKPIKENKEEPQKEKISIEGITEEQELYNILLKRIGSQIFFYDSAKIGYSNSDDYNYETHVRYFVINNYTLKTLNLGNINDYNDSQLTKEYVESSYSEYIKEYEIKSIVNKYNSSIDITLLPVDTTSTKEHYITYHVDEDYIEYKEPGYGGLVIETLYFNENGVENEQQNDIEETRKKEKPLIGMTSSEVKNTKWGYPDDINKDTYSWGTTEQWVYDDYGYVYFKNGIVTSVSER